MPRPKGSREISVSDIEKIVELSQKGLSRPEIAKRVGFSENTVWRYQKEYEVL
ncbi:MAG: helix-turn-helix domain-containing protein [Thermoplasmata archaeon]